MFGPSHLALTFEKPSGMLRTRAGLSSWLATGASRPISRAFCEQPFAVSPIASAARGNATARRVLISSLPLPAIGSPMTATHPAGILRRDSDRLTALSASCHPADDRTRDKMTRDQAEVEFS